MMAPTGERLTRIDMVVGTPEYMSPEQCAGRDAGPASDQYSLGVVAFEALTGHVPYEAETPAAVMLEQIQAPLPDPRTVNPELSENIELSLMRALAKDPADRFASCGEFVEAIAGKTTAPLPAPVKEKPMPAVAPAPAPGVAAAVRGGLPRSRVLVAAGVIALLVVASVAVALVALRPGSTSGVQATNGPAHGSLLFDLKPTSAAWSGGAEPSPDPDKSIGISYTSSSIDLHILKTGAGIGAEFDGPKLKNYVADLTLKADTGSDFGLNWEMITAGDNESAEVYLHIDFAQETMTLILSPYSGSDQAMTATIPVPRLQQGITADIAAVVSSGSITIYLNGDKVGQGSETKASGATSPTLYMNGDHGTLHILSMRYYALP
jgi:hypothetical protein